MPDLAARGPADLALLVARFGAALHAAGLPVGPDRSERFARAVLLVRPTTTRALYWCATATLVGDRGDLPVFDRVFDLVFGGLADPGEQRGDAGNAEPPVPGTAPTPPAPARQPRPPGGQPWFADRGHQGDRAASEIPHPALAAATERLAERDFADLSPDELVRLVELMRRLRVATPLRRTRRRSPAARGSTVDLRATLRHARRTAGHPVRLHRRRPHRRPRRLVVLCDISGSMAPYARAMLQLLYCAAGGASAEVFTFATRLTRLTRLLGRTSAAQALDRAGRAAPDWSGGTRIGATLKEFNDRYGARGVARGAVVLVVSDGWDTGDPAQLRREMARLSRLAYRIVWANPRTKSARYQPLVGGMAAAWPYCDAVVSAHDIAALDDLLDALAEPAARRSR
ncbi:VWA domain-containing protein [Micromonospora sp. WMMC415]|uniref:vWA domain-containing protein n=1 Tax=Micromonospora sp. WMMC415 TaxID=2675222 RepID=UPI0012B49C24|nr:VWA domain-containing protein [Micromonospora sp. WMMC415]QGN48595.1 VWA domain-containing protein [Micromonospora sp. WMMC415]